MMLRFFKFTPPCLSGPEISVDSSDIVFLARAYEKNKDMTTLHLRGGETVLVEMPFDVAEGRLMEVCKTPELRRPDPIAYKETTLPDFGPWPTMATFAPGIKWTGDVRSRQPTIEEWGAYNAAIRIEVARRQALYATHRREPDGAYEVRTACFLVLVERPQDDETENGPRPSYATKIFATDSESLVKCEDCHRVIARRRQTERVRRGLETERTQ